MRRPQRVRSVFPNGMAYFKYGDGPKTLLMVPGGPGNVFPIGFGLMMRRMLRQYLDHGYEAWVVTRRQNMPQGWTIEDMADDYARLIKDEFGGRVGLFLGISFGGMIGQYLAVNHAESFDHIALVGAGYEPDAEAAGLDYRLAQKLGEGKTGEAGVIVAEDMFSSPRLQRFGWLASVIGPPVGHLMYPRSHDHFEKDVLTEADAFVAFDSRGDLPRIEVPVLLITGDQDYAFPPDVMRETARLIPNSKLILYEDTSHEGAIGDKRLAGDVLEFVGS